MGGEQASSVLSTLKRDQIEAKGGTWSAEEEDQFKQPIRDQYERQGHPYYASARLWDDGVIDPAQSREVLAFKFGCCPQCTHPTDQIWRVPHVRGDKMDYQFLQLEQQQSSGYGLD